MTQIFRLIGVISALALAPQVAVAAGPDETPIALCAAIVADDGGNGGCVCSVEGAEDLLSPADYWLVITMWHRAAMLTRMELSTLKRDQQTACGRTDVSTRSRTAAVLR